MFTSAHARDLAIHIYNAHIIHRTEWKSFPNAVEVKDKPKEPSDIHCGKPGTTELEDQLQSTATPEMAEVKPGEPSGTPYEHINDAETGGFLLSDTGNESDVPEGFDFVTDIFLSHFIGLDDYSSGPVSKV